MPFHRCMVKGNVVYMHSGVLLSCNSSDLQTLGEVLEDGLSEIRPAQKGKRDDGNHFSHVESGRADLTEAEGVRVGSRG